MKSAPLNSLGLVDLHFHGAFGIDLMTAKSDDLDLLSQTLWQNGIGAFCATTLSVAPAPLLEAVTRLGQWIQNKSWQGAVPLGIHLEGPYINPEAGGAHPPTAIRPLDLTELETLWIASQKTLKIVTLAPELLNTSTRDKLIAWAKTRRIILSIGHSKATEAETREALAVGFKGITHAWNAMNFHHRTPGILGGALGTKNTYVEVIIDQIHVAQTAIRWTLALHPEGTCFVSDCAPAAATEPGTWHPFGHLAVRIERGACRLPEGHLAGGGKLLTHAYVDWLAKEATETSQDLRKLLRSTLPCLIEHPLKGIGLTSKALGKRRLRWQVLNRNTVVFGRR